MYHVFGSVPLGRAGPRAAGTLAADARFVSTCLSFLERYTPAAKDCRKFLGRNIFATPFLSNELSCGCDSSVPA